MPAVITARRLRAYAPLIAICLWTVFAIDMATPGPLDRLGKVKGTDFVHFFVIGSIARDRRWSELFDANAQYARARVIAPGSHELLFVPVESPQLALLFAPLTTFGYTSALAIWLVLGVTIYIACCVLVWRDATALHAHRDIFIGACAACPGLFSAVLHGQTAWLSLACVVGALVAFRRSNTFTAGLSLGLLVFKPHWALAAVLVCACAREWRALAGAIVSALAETLLTAALVGGNVMLAYARVLRDLPVVAGLLEPRHSDSLRGFVQLFVPSPSMALVLYAAAALVTLLILARIPRADAAMDLRLASLVLAMVLVSPHVNVYDLLLLAPVCVMLANWCADRAGKTGSGSDDRAAWLPRLTVVLFLAPIGSGLPDVLRVPCTVGAMAGALLLVGYLLRRRIWFWMPWNAGDTSAAVGA
jgi:hypothetical protein